jgi:hypothetical protein
MRSRYHLIYEHHREATSSGAVLYALRCERENLNGDPPRVVARREICIAFTSAPENANARAPHARDAASGRFLPLPRRSLPPACRPAAPHLDHNGQ